jgi:cardiolipin synthase
MAQIISIIQWIGGVILLLAFAMLLVLYFRGAFRKRIDYRAIDVPGPSEERFMAALGSLSNSLGTTGCVTGFWLKADEIQPARLEAIQSAQRTIHFETFFMTPGRRANDFAAAVAERAAAGVEVQLIVDGYGTRTLPKKYWQRLQKAGVEVRVFNPFSWRAPFDYAGRTHRKLLSIDGKIALIGGAGVSDYWDGMKEIGDTTSWFDFEFRLEGAVVSVLEGMFMQHWAFAGGTVDLGAENFHVPRDSDYAILVTPGEDPSYRSSSMRSLFTTCILSAQKRIWISSPYFLPNHDSRQALVRAKKNGADVRILTTSSRSDKKFVYYASAELYREMLSGGVKIHEYQPSMLHAKSILIDDRWVSTGSANFDPRSFYHNDELNITTTDPQLLQHVEQLFLTAFDDCQLVTMADWRDRPLWQRLVGRLVLFFQSQL